MNTDKFTEVKSKTQKGKQTKKEKRKNQMINFDEEKEETKVQTPKAQKNRNQKIKFHEEEKEKKGITEEANQTKEEKITMKGLIQEEKEIVGEKEITEENFNKKLVTSNLTKKKISLENIRYEMLEYISHFFKIRDLYSVSNLNKRIRSKMIQNNIALKKYKEMATKFKTIMKYFIYKSVNSKNFLKLKEIYDELLKDLPEPAVDDIFQMQLSLYYDTYFIINEKKKLNEFNLKILLLTLENENNFFKEIKIENLDHSDVNKVSAALSSKTRVENLILIHEPTEIDKFYNFYLNLGKSTGVENLNFFSYNNLYSSYKSDERTIENRYGKRIIFLPSDKLKIRETYLTSFFEDLKENNSIKSLSMNFVNGEKLQEKLSSALCKNKSVTKLHLSGYNKDNFEFLTVNKTLKQLKIEGIFSISPLSHLLCLNEKGETATSLEHLNIKVLRYLKYEDIVPIDEMKFFLKYSTVPSLEITQPPYLNEFFGNIQKNVHIQKLFIHLRNSFVVNDYIRHDLPTNLSELTLQATEFNFIDDDLEVLIDKIEKNENLILINLINETKCLSLGRKGRQIISKCKKFKFIY